MSVGGAYGGTRRENPAVEVSDRLRGDLHDDTESARSVAELVRDAIPTMTRTVEQGSWPYEIRKGAPAQKKESLSTNAMIAFALAVLGGDVAGDQLVPGRQGERAPGSDPTQPWLKEDQHCVWRHTARQLADRDAAETFQSRTYGRDDPFTVYWAYRLVEALVSAGEPVSHVGLLERAESVVGRLDEPRKPMLRFPDGECHGGGDRAPTHVWPLVRVVHLARALEKDPSAETQEYLIERVLVQLSYSEITDSLFDVGELVFAFEGALVCDDRSCSRTLVERVADVVTGSQARNPSLRVLSPFRVTGAGSVNTPVSIEVATALLRCCWILVGSSSPIDLFSRVHGVFERYLDWLRSSVQVVKVEGQDKPFTGWRSEHAFTAEPTIHTWYTSQVVLFLASYRAMIDQHVADSSLRSARFSVRLPSARSESWGDREPLESAAAGSDYRVYEQLKQNFIDPRAGRSQTDPQRSFLLYGPPGTGKTSLVEALADELGWEMITITPSDFIVGGESQVEARAKDIFDVLGFQSEKVILFDEIDRLLLDRDSPEYGAQSDLFQFMTPSMLPKLQGLNDQGGNIVCIATNYAWRIDRAITRPGRIDNRFLLLPPDRAKRESIVMALLSRQGKPDDLGRRVAAETPLFSYGELKAAVGGGDRPTEATLLESCASITPAARPESYRRQLKSLRDDQRPPPPALVEEYLLLRFLELEAVPDPGGTGLTGDDLALIGGPAALDVVRDAAIKERLWPPSP